MAVKYPPAAQELIDGVRLPNLGWLDAGARADMAEMLRFLRNDLAATFAQTAIRKDPRRAWTGRDRESTFGQAHDDAERLMTDWFLRRSDDVLLPTFDGADRALQQVRERPEPGSDIGAQRFARMSSDRRREYGIPDDYFTAEKTTAKNELAHLARMVGLPEGYLLLELRMNSGLSGNKRKDLPIRQWLKDRITFALETEGVTPHGGISRRAPAVPAKPLDDVSALVDRVNALRIALGSMTKVFELAGDAKQFENVVGIKPRTVESWIWEGKQPRPGSVNKLKAFLETVEPLVAEHARQNEVILHEIAAQHLGTTRPLFEPVPVVEELSAAARDFSCGCDGRGL